ncbi:MAG: bifunctional histidinol-phosphatase/imidazoleglycerol-phosphate dehydratase HisB [Ferruginibacter sp.]|nr:bifunctional histidinol-phosphatase/imidazoleglycerol-phosphate dehydratase HisB [Cytophagales bacterium]
MKKVLFIDRDGTVIAEPKPDCQVDSFEKLVFMPRALSNLRKIAEELDYELVMVTNQDGLGTTSFPEEAFWPVHRRMILTLAGENVHFAHVHIDRSFEHEDAPTRKPRTGMLTDYFNGTYDLANSFVIGDRLTDAQLALNLGAKAILLADPAPPLPSQLADTVSLRTADWDEVYQFLRLPARRAEVHRLTNETQIHVLLDLDGTGKSDVRTGLGFFDHMLDQLAKHSGSDLTLRVRGDLHIDEHHTIEDTALALGEAYQKALGDKRGIGRYGFLLPMDDALAQAAIDFSGRNWLVWETEFKREKIGEMPTEMFYHFFKSFTDAAKCNLNVKAEGQNEHHKIEAIFKAVAKSIRMAVARDTGHLQNLPTTKGVL